MPVSAAITFRMAMGSGYVAVMRGTPVTPMTRHPTALHHMVISSSQPLADLLLSMAAERRR